MSTIEASPPSRVQALSAQHHPHNSTSSTRKGGRGSPISFDESAYIAVLERDVVGDHDCIPHVDDVQATAVATALVSRATSGVRSTTPPWTESDATRKRCGSLSALTQMPNKSVSISSHNGVSTATASPVVIPFEELLEMYGLERSCPLDVCAGLQIPSSSTDDARQSPIAWLPGPTTGVTACTSSRSSDECDEQSIRSSRPSQAVARLSPTTVEVAEKVLLPSTPIGSRGALSSHIPDMNTLSDSTEGATPPHRRWGAPPPQSLNALLAPASAPPLSLLGPRRRTLSLSSFAVSKPLLPRQQEERPVRLYNSSNLDMSVTFDGNAYPQRLCCMTQDDPVDMGAVEKGLHAYAVPRRSVGRISAGAAVACARDGTSLDREGIAVEPPELYLALLSPVQARDATPASHQQQQRRLSLSQVAATEAPKSHELHDDVKAVRTGQRFTAVCAATTTGRKLRNTTKSMLSENAGSVSSPLAQQPQQQQHNNCSTAAAITTFARNSRQSDRSTSDCRVDAPAMLSDGDAEQQYPMDSTPARAVGTCFALWDYMDADELCWMNVDGGPGRWRDDDIQHIDGAGTSVHPCRVTTAELTSLAPLNSSAASGIPSAARLSGSQQQSRLCLSLDRSSQCECFNGDSFGSVVGNDSDGLQPRQQQQQVVDALRGLEMQHDSLISAAPSTPNGSVCSLVRKPSLCRDTQSNTGVNRGKETLYFTFSRVPESLEAALQSRLLLNAGVNEDADSFRGVAAESRHASWSNLYGRSSRRFQEQNCPAARSLDSPVDTALTSLIAGPRHYPCSTSGSIGTSYLTIDSHQGGEYGLELFSSSSGGGKGREMRAGSDDEGDPLTSSGWRRYMSGFSAGYSGRRSDATDRAKLSAQDACESCSRSITGVGSIFLELCGSCSSRLYNSIPSLTANNEELLSAAAWNAASTEYNSVEHVHEADGSVFQSDRADDSSVRERKGLNSSDQDRESSLDTHVDMGRHSEDSSGTDNSRSGSDNDSTEGARESQENSVRDNEPTFARSHRSDSDDDRTGIDTVTRRSIDESNLRSRSANSAAAAKPRSEVGTVACLPLLRLRACCAAVPAASVAGVYLTAADGPLPHVHGLHGSWATPHPFPNFRFLYAVFVPSLGPHLVKHTNVTVSEGRAYGAGEGYSSAVYRQSLTSNSSGPTDDPTPNNIMSHTNVDIGYRDGYTEGFAMSYSRATSISNHYTALSTPLHYVQAAGSRADSLELPNCLAALLVNESAQRQCVWAVERHDPRPPRINLGASRPDLRSATSIESGESTESFVPTMQPRPSLIAKADVMSGVCPVAAEWFMFSALDIRWVPSPALSPDEGELDVPLRTDEVPDDFMLE